MRQETETLESDAGSDMFQDMVGNSMKKGLTESGKSDKMVLQVTDLCAEREECLPLIWACGARHK
jgi:hypothetical protein